MTEKEMIKVIKVPEQIKVEVIDDNTLELKSDKGSLKRTFKSHRLKISHKGEHITLEGAPSTKQTKALIESVTAHIRNMVEGLLFGYKIKLKICYSHFPMTAMVEGERLKIKNFTGEKDFRYAKIVPGAKVEVKAQEITITGIDKEVVGQTAGNMELATKVRGGKDIRRLQDGIFVTEREYKHKGSEELLKVESEKVVEVQ